MTPVRRWLLVALGVLLVVGAPVALRALPASDADVDAATLLARVRDAAPAAYAGYVESEGTLQLPVTDSFTDVGALFGERTRIRVWWRSADDWRVDKLLTAGETDLVHQAGRTTEWSYERARATVYTDPDIRLPRTADLLPPTLAHRLLADVDPTELSRLDARRVAGRDALGLRLAPGAARSSIEHVDLWADADTGIPLRVEVYGAGSTPALTTAFREFSPTRPDRAQTSFQLPPGADLRLDDVLDIADAANQFADVVPPAEVAGLARSSASRGAVGVYGTGVTQIIAVPLWDRAAVPLREQLGTTPGSRLVADGTYVAVGPLGVLLTDLPGGAGWLVAGTVTEQTLSQAAVRLDRQVLGGRR